MANDETIATVGKIFLLVSAILAVVGGAFLIIFGAGFGVIFSTILEDDPEFYGGAIIATLYIVLGILNLVGAALGFVAYDKANKGDLAAGFGFGLASSLLPPLRVFALIGAILCKVAEGKEDG